jgi:hypothetical protein
MTLNKGYQVVDKASKKMKEREEECICRPSVGKDQERSEGREQERESET